MIYNVSESHSVPRKQESFREEREHRKPAVTYKDLIRNLRKNMCYLTNK